MAATASTSSDQTYPGSSVGLPQTGPGRLAGWMPRLTALVLDWAISMLIVVMALGTPALTAVDWRRWAVLGVFFVATTCLSAITGASAGQIICRLAVVRVDGSRLGLARALLRQALLCLVIPALVIGVDRRGLHDMAANTVVVSRH